MNLNVPSVVAEIGAELSVLLVLNRVFSMEGTILCVAELDDNCVFISSVKVGVREVLPREVVSQFGKEEDVGFRGCIKPFLTEYCYIIRFPASGAL